MRKYSRFKELICCLVGHCFDATGSETDSETGIVLSSFVQCTDCGIRIVDESGHRELYKIKYG